MLTTIDFYLSSNTVAFKRTWHYLLVYGAIYSLFSLVWNVAARWAIYPYFMDWVHYPLLSVITFLAVLVLSVLLHLFLCWTHNKLVAKYADVRATAILPASTVKNAEVDAVETIVVEQGSSDKQAQLEPGKELKAEDGTPPSQTTETDSYQD
mmetsp:Transcript_688/g.1031  ORF Transcript_688/g.1031 Transcript_688/m.1031 type:complete len:152 (+) Transcript_688:1-456(+)